MAEGFLPAGAGTALDAAAAAYRWVKLFVGAPGAAGSTNPATNTTRMQATWNTTGSDGIVDNSVALTWTNVSTAEDYTHFVAMSAETEGTAGFSGTVTANAVMAGDNFTVGIGGLTASVTLAS